MRVLHIDCGRHMRGGQWQALYLMVGQKTLGVDPHLVAPAASPLLQMAAERGVPVTPLSAWSLHRLSKDNSILHAHDARGHTWGALAGPAALVVSRRVAFPIGASLLSRWKYRRAARYLAVSEFVASRLRAAGIPAEKIGIVYDGVPVSPARPVGDEVVVPAWNDPRKGMHLAREAARMAGVKLKESDDLDRDLNSARLLLYLTEMEGLGSAALLAMSRGVPVVASRVGGLPEIVRHGVTGVLVENRADEVAGAVRALLDNRESAAALGRQGREMVLEGFTLAHMALRTLNEYKKVTG
jgi:glycosyltransferase involved in cell wall biosynthesis